MAPTQTQLEMLATNMLHKGIAKTVVTESELLRYLPQSPVYGNAVQYNMEVTEAGIDFYDPNETWTEGNAIWREFTVPLKIVGGDADVDKFMEVTRNQQNMKAAVIELKAKALAHKYEKAIILGRTTASSTWSSTKVFKGLLRLIAEFESSTTTDLDGVNNSQVYAAHATSVALTLDMIGTLIRRVPGCTHLMMNGNTVDRVEALARAAGNNLKVQDGMLGMPVLKWGRQTIIVNDNVPDNAADNSSSVNAIASYDPTTTRAAGYDNTFIFALRFDELDGVCGLTNGGIQTEDITKGGTLETKDASRTRIKMYAGLAIYNLKAAAVMTGATRSSST